MKVVPHRYATTFKAHWPLSLPDRLQGPFTTGNVGIRIIILQFTALDVIVIQIYYLEASVLLTVLYRPLMPPAFNLPLKSPTASSSTLDLPCHSHTELSVLTLTLVWETMSRQVFLQLSNAPLF